MSHQHVNLSLNTHVMGYDMGLGLRFVLDMLVLH